MKFLLLVTIYVLSCVCMIVYLRNTHDSHIPPTRASGSKVKTAAADDDDNVMAREHGLSDSRPFIWYLLLKA